MSVELLLAECHIDGIQLFIHDLAGSTASASIVGELQEDRYGLKNIKFEPGDIVIDIGGHVGIVSVFLAKKYPFLKIYAYEPIRQNFDCFVLNLQKNNVPNVIVHHCAVTSDGRELAMALNPINTGGATSNTITPLTYSIKSVKLSDIFENYHMTQCKLLKIDCEGSEHEILLHTKLLSRVDYIAAEFHMNTYLEQQGYSLERLYAHCIQYVKEENITLTAGRMCE